MTRVNRIDIDALKQTVDALKEDPELGRCQFRVRNRWIDANRSVGSVRGFHAAGQEREHQGTFESYADEPPILAGDDTAANPVEHLLTALAACLTTSMVAHAAVRGIEIQELESEVEGDIDLNGYMGLSDEVPKGYQQIRVRFTARSDADARTLRQLAEFSPVFNTLLDGVRVELRVDTPLAMGEAGGPQEARRAA